MNKIFQIGFNKCGTTSLHNFFLSNNLKSIHWDRSRLAKKINHNYNNNLPLLKGYEQYNCFTDMESLNDNIFIYLSLYKELDKQYPNSKFILNIRNKENWINSRIKHRNYLKIYQKITGLTKEGVITHWNQIWDEHINNVQEYFTNRKLDLLVFDIENDSPDKLIDFMSTFIIIKNNQFKKLNKTKC